MLPMHVTPAGTSDDMHERRHLVLLLALLLSMLTHLGATFIDIEGSPRPRSAHAPGPMLFVDTPGTGADEAAGQTPAASAAETTDPVTAPQPAARPRPRAPAPAADPALVAVVTEEAEAPDVQADVQGDVEGEAELSDEAFLAALAARASGGVGSGSGAGGECADPVRGVWRAHRYDDARGRHVAFTLRVDDVSPIGDLDGSITLRAWSGEREQTSPPRCAPGVADHTVRQPARGRFVRGEFDFRGRSHQRTVHCIDAGRWVYNLDHFSGRIDGDQLQAVNNDGGNERDTPYRFRRIRCL